MITKEIVGHHYFYDGIKKLTGSPRLDTSIKSNAEELILLIRSHCGITTKTKLTYDITYFDNGNLDTYYLSFEYDISRIVDVKREITCFRLLFNLDK